MEVPRAPEGSQCQHYLSILVRHMLVLGTTAKELVEQYQELLDITTWHASGKEATGVVFVLGDGKMILGGSWAAPSKATGKGTKKCPNGGKKRKKQHPRWVTVVTSSNDDNTEADGSNEEYVVATERDF
jgi:hypothetical protein